MNSHKREKSTGVEILAIEKKRVNVAPRRRPRRDVRVQTNLPVTLLVKLEGEKRVHAALAVDVSAQGLKVQTAAGLSSRQTVYVFSRNAKSQFGPCRVVWTRTGEPGQHVEAGLEFLK